jgi:hypothetical protein
MELQKYDGEPSTFEKKLTDDRYEANIKEFAEAASVTWDQIIGGFDAIKSSMRDTARALAAFEQEYTQQPSYGYIAKHKRDRARAKKAKRKHGGPR